MNFEPKSGTDNVFWRLWERIAWAVPGAGAEIESLFCCPPELGPKRKPKTPTPRSLICRMRARSPLDRGAAKPTKK
jgi:hypothetical protein